MLDRPEVVEKKKRMSKIVTPLGSFVVENVVISGKLDMECDED